jgi:hypothetical protein
MKRLRLVGLVFTVVFALSVVASTTASAENPEILPNPTATAPLKFTAEGGRGTVETTNGTIMTCTKGRAQGEFTSVRLGTASGDAEGCRTGNANCTSTGDPAGVILESNVDIHLVDFKVKTTLELGIVGKPKETVKIKCGILSVEGRGAGLGKVEGVKSLEKTNTAKVISRQTKGEQELKTCELDKAFCAGQKFVPEVNFGAAGFELAGGEGEGKVTFAKEIEVHF